MSDARKRELKRRAKAEMRKRADAEWDENMVLTPEQLHGLLGYLDERLGEEGCNHTLRLTRAWAAEAGVDAEELEDSVIHFGAGCDCEVLANVDPQTQVDGWPRYLELYGPG